MKTIALWLTLVVAGVPGIGAAGAQGSEGKMDLPHFVVLPHDGKAQLRLVYEGDPSGKTIGGDEASRIWLALTR